jgi:hypothetical protein
MTPFLLHIALRATSGFQNGAGYGKHNIAMIGTTTAIALITLYTFVFTLTTQWAILLIATFTANIAMPIIFQKKAYKWIHLTESILTASFALALLIEYPIPTASSVYPGLLLHKIGVNTMAGNKWNYNGTDDPTGKTWTLHIFRWSISIPRLSFNTRIILAALSIVAFIIYTIL